MQRIGEDLQICCETVVGRSCAGDPMAQSVSRIAHAGGGCAVHAVAGRAGNRVVDGRAHDAVEDADPRGRSAPLDGDELVLSKHAEGAVEVVDVRDGSDREGVAAAIAEHGDRAEGRDDGRVQLGDAFAHGARELGCRRERVVARERRQLVHRMLVKE